MNIQYLELNNKCFIKALDNETLLGIIVLDIKCDEYSRYKEYCNGNKLVKIVRVETNPNFIGKGIASKLIKLAIERYNDHNFVLLCSPCKRSENTDTLKSVADLQMFYSKFGFVKSTELLPTMIRKTV